MKLTKVVPYHAGEGELAQMVERSLSMREVPGSMPGFYNLLTDKKESRVESQKGTTQIEGK